MEYLVQKVSEQVIHLFLLPLPFSLLIHLRRRHQLELLLLPLLACFLLVLELPHQLVYLEYRFSFRVIQAFLHFHF